MKKIFLIIFIIIISYQDDFSKSYILNDIRNSDICLFNNDNIISIFVFAQNPCGRTCFLKLNDYFKNVINKNKMIISYLIIKSQDNIISRRLEMDYFKNCMSFDSIYFDPNIEKFEENNILKYSFFNKFKIQYTPSILIIYKDKEIYFPYSSFKNYNYSIIGKKIDELIK